MNSGSGPAVTVGLFDWVDSDGVREPAQLYAERLDLLADAEARGFDIYHLAEHHSTPLGLVPSPSVFLAAAAVRTTRIRLCPLVYVLPFYQPVRLAEEIAMLDQLSGGRLEVGLGKGGNPYELLAYGIEPGDAQRRYDEVLAAVLRTLETGTVGAPGTAAAAAELPVRPARRPARRSGTPPATRPASRPWASGGSTPFSGSASGPPRSRRPGCGGTSTSRAWRTRRRGPRWAVRGCRRRALGSCATSMWESRPRRQGTRDRGDGGVLRQFTALWRRHGDDRFTGPQDFARAIDEGLVIAGSAATVRAQLTGMLRASGCNHFAGAFAFGSLSHAEARLSLARFGEEVAPALRQPGGMVSGAAR